MKAKLAFIPKQGFYLQDELCLQHGVEKHEPGLSGQISGLGPGNI